MKKHLVFAAVSTALFSSLSFAADTKKESAFDVTAELGILLTSGNTESSSVFTKLVAKHELEKWSNKYTFDMLKKESEIKDADGNKQTQETIRIMNIQSELVRTF